MKRTALIGILAVGLGIAASGLVAATNPPPPVFGPHPRYRFTGDEIAAWKADPARSNEWAAAVARGHAALKADLTVPRKEGQWIFYYACPRDNSRLQAESAERHVCPSCKKVYTDERTQAAYRTQVNCEIDNRCYDLAVAYALTGDSTFADPARQVLLDLAALYPGWRHHDRWGRTGLLAAVGGWRYGQLLDEATSLIRLASAYDLIVPAVGADDRRRIETDFLKRVSGQVRACQIFIDAQNNHQTWFNAAYAAVGLVTGDAGLIEDAIHGTRGLLWQLENSVTADGVWYEGAMAYHFYALSAIEDSVDAARRVGWDLRTNDRLRSLWTGPVQMAYPNGQIPVLNDSDPASLRNFAEHYRWAARFFDDPRYLEMAGETPSGLPRLPSAALRGIGVAVLRRGAGRDASCVMMDYGIHGGHHGHPDKLSIVVFARGAEWVLDPGRISYSVPEYETWCRTTVAHNTVVVGGRNQEPATGELVTFEETSEAAACFAATDKAYPGIKMARFLVLADGFLADVISVQAKRPEEMDWVVHLRGSPTSITHDARSPGPIAFEPWSGSLGKRDGYPHLAVTGKARGEEAATWSLVQPGGGSMRVFLAGDRDSTFYTGEGIGYRLTDRVPFLIRRRKGAAELFVTVYELGEAGSILGVDAIRDAGNPLRVRINVTNATESVSMDLDLAFPDGSGQEGSRFRMERR